MPTFSQENRIWIPSERLTGDFWGHCPLYYNSLWSNGSWNNDANKFEMANVNNIRSTKNLDLTRINSIFARFTQKSMKIKLLQNKVIDHNHYSGYVLQSYIPKKKKNNKRAKKWFTIIAHMPNYPTKEIDSTKHSTETETIRKTKFNIKYVYYIVCQ